MAPCAPPPASLRPGSAVLGALVPWWSVGGLLPPVRPRRSARACVRAAGVGPLRSLASLGGGAVRRDAPRGLWLVVRGCLGSSVCAAARPLGGALACGCALVWGVFVVRAPGGARVGRLRAFGGVCVCAAGCPVPPCPASASRRARWRGGRSSSGLACGGVISLFRLSRRSRRLVARRLLLGGASPRCVRGAGRVDRLGLGGGKIYLVATFFRATL